MPTDQQDMNDMYKENEKAFIQAIANVYNSEELAGVNDQFHLFLRDSIISQNGGDSVLEIGCGKGLWTKVFCEKYKTVDVIDGSDELLKSVANDNRGKKAKLTVHPCLIDDFEPGSQKEWEHIYLTFLLEHLVDPVFVLNRIKRFLLKNGLLFIVVPNANSLHRVLALRMGLIEHVEELSENDKIVGHRRVYTSDLLRKHITSAGYIVVSEVNIGLKPLSLKQMEDWSQDLVWAFCSSGDLCKKNCAYLGMIATHR